MTKLLYRHVNLSSGCHWLKAAYLIVDTEQVDSEGSEGRAGAGADKITVAVQA